MQNEDVVTRAIKKSQSYTPYLLAAMALLAGLIAVLLTIGAIKNPAVVTTSAINSIALVGSWLITGYLIYIWFKFRPVYAWMQNREVLQRKGERINAYIAQADEGTLPPEIRQDWQDLFAEWQRQWRDE
jgi:hypothetical protein